MKALTNESPNQSSTKKSKKKGRYAHASQMPIPEQLALAAAKGSKSVFQLSEGVRNYLAAVHDPFDAPLPARLPILPILPTQCLRSYAKDFTVFITSGGIGYISVAPAEMLATDGLPILYTSATTGPIAPNDAFHIVTPATLGTNAPYSKPQYTGGSSSPNHCAARIVGCGIRAEYTGRLINESGVVKTFTSPTLSHTGPLSFNNLSLYPGTKTGNSRRDRTYVLTRPVLQTSQNDYMQWNTDESVWVNAAYDYPGGRAPESPDTQNYMIMAFNGLPGETYNVSVACIFEVFGLPAAAAETGETVPDRQSTEMVQAHHRATMHGKKFSMSGTNPIQRQLTGPTLFNQFSKWVGSNISHFGPALGRAAIKAAPYILPL